MKIEKILNYEVVKTSLDQEVRIQIIDFALLQLKSIDKIKKEGSPKLKRGIDVLWCNQRYRVMFRLYPDYAAYDLRWEVISVTAV